MLFDWFKRGPDFDEALDCVEELLARSLLIRKKFGSLTRPYAFKVLVDAANQISRAKGIETNYRSSLCLLL